MEKVTFNLNEGLIFKAVFDKTNTNLAVKRSVRPFMNSLNKAINEAKSEYNKIRDEVFKDEKTSQEEKQSLFGGKVADYNNKIILDIDFEKNSTRNFFYSFWNRFEFNPDLFGDNISDIVEEIDQKVCAIYPQLDVNIDKEETKEETK